MKLKVHKNPVHVFTLVVKGAGTRRVAELAVLAAFAKRDPDGCSFKLNGKYSEKDAYIAGSMSGVQLGFEMALRAVKNQRLKLKRRQHHSKHRNGRTS